MFRYLILGMLRGGGQRHGYALVKEYRERSGTDVSTGNFYRELQRLVLDGLIRATENPPGSDARRTPYEITAVGRTVFDEWLLATDAGAFGASEDELSARVLFADQVEPATMLRVLDRLQENVWFSGKCLERGRMQALAGSDLPPDSPAFRVLPLLQARRLKHVAADIEFLAELRAAYETHCIERPAVADAAPAATRREAAERSSRRRRA